MIVINSKNEWVAKLEAAKAEGKAVIVDFFAEWCGPCKQIAPVYEALSNETPSMYFLKLNVDDVEDLAAECKVSAMPTFQVYKDNVKVDEMIGASKDKLTALVAKYK